MRGTPCMLRDKTAKILKNTHFARFFSRKMRILGGKETMPVFCKLPHNLNLMLLLCALPQKFCFFSRLGPKVF